LEGQPLARREMLRAIEQQEIGRAQGPDAGEQSLFLGDGAVGLNADQVGSETPRAEARDELFEKQSLAGAMRADDGAAPFGPGAAVQESFPSQAGGKTKEERLDAMRGERIIAWPHC